MLDCPNVLSGDRQGKFLNRYLPQLAAERGSYLLVMETQGLVSSEELTGLDMRLLEVFPRPGNVSEIQLYLVTP